MNVFRMSADLLHLLSIVVLLLKLYGTQNCSGISLKTQGLYALVFCCRYMDMFWNFWSMYNWAMKAVFITSSVAIIWLMKYKQPCNKTYDRKADDFNVVFILIPCVVAALIFNVSFTPFEIFWAFSIYLESVAILPQLVMLHHYAKTHSGTVKNLTSQYMMCLGTYRALYVFNWIYRYSTESRYWDPISWTAGTIQTLLFIDFFYYYVKARIAGTQMTLPV